jgi:RNA polymerase sigma-70 factor (ECF subfamily)
MTPLTDEQRDFAEENYGLVFSFMLERDLIEDDFFDIIIFGYLMAVQRYLERPDLRKYPFGTVAGKHMRRELNHYFTSRYFAKRNAEVFSLCARPNDGLELHERIAAPNHEVHESLEARETWESIRPLARPHEMETLKLRAQGYGC